MKFGKYLAARQLELPEYQGHFIDYKALKKLIKNLSSSTPTSTPDTSNIESNLISNKSTFFFRVERELEKVNSFYLEKQSNLIIDLNILVLKKKKLLSSNQKNFKNSITYLNLYNSFKKISQDLKKLQIFIELNELGFTKVLKKWDKRSKSHTKELFISTAVNVQPVFHKNEMNELSDLVVTNLVELESRTDGSFKFDEDIIIEKDQFNLPKFISPAQSIDMVSNNKTLDTNSEAWKASSPDPDSTTANASTSNDKQIDELYTQILQILAQSPSQLEGYIDSTSSPQLSKIFQLLLSHLQIQDSVLIKFLKSNKIDFNIKDDLGRSLLHTIAQHPTSRESLIPFIIPHVSPTLKDTTNKTCLHYAAETPRPDLLHTLLPHVPPHLQNVPDNDSMTPLLIGIRGKNIDVVKEVLKGSGVKFVVPVYGEYLPLNYACLIGDHGIVAALVNYIRDITIGKDDSNTATPCIESTGDVTASNTANSASSTTSEIPTTLSSLTGLSNQAPKLTPQEAFKILNQPDVEGFPPLHVAASNGYADIIGLLLENGADLNMIDLNGKNAAYYACIGGFVDVVRILLNSAEFTSSISHDDEDMIDESEITKKIIKKNENRDQEGMEKGCLYGAVFEGWVDVLNVLLESIDFASSSKNIAIERLPSPHKASQQENDKEENLDSIPDFQLPPPVIPLRRYGHNFLERKTFIQLNFLAEAITLYNATDSSTPGRLTLSSPISDIIPRNLLLPISEENNQLTFQINSNQIDNFKIDFELFPSFGTRLIAKTTSLSIFFSDDDKINGNVKLPFFDSMLKNIGDLKFGFQIVHPYEGLPLEISKFDTYWKSTGGQQQQLQKQQSLQTQQKQQFVTASSLAGSYIRIKVFMLEDGTPIVCPSWFVEVNGIKILLSNLSIDQIKHLTDSLYDYPKLIRDLNGLSDLKLIEKLLKIIYIPLEQFLSYISHKISLDVELIYPSEYELRRLNFSTNLKTCLNYFIDRTLTNIFNHTTSRSSASDYKSRSIIFTSTNQLICKILNWKQPNYPVLLNVNNIVSTSSHKFKLTSINGLELPHTPTPQPQQNERETDHTSLKEQLKFVTNNNLLGMVLPSSLLQLIPELIDTVRSRGLILVGSKKNEDTSNIEDLIDGYTVGEIVFFK